MYERDSERKVIREVPMKLPSKEDTLYLQDHHLDCQSSLQYQHYHIHGSLRWSSLLQESHYISDCIV